jgi:threonine aldolase
MLEQIIADAEGHDEEHGSGRLEIFGEVHRRIILAWLTAVRTRPAESISLK